MDETPTPRRITINIPEGMGLKAIAEALSAYVLGPCAYCNPAGTHGIRPLGPRSRPDGTWILDLNGNFWVELDPMFPDKVILSCGNPKELPIMSAMMTLFEWKHPQKPKSG